MIQLRPDCLVFQTSDGEHIPCAAELVTIELMGDSAAFLDPDVVHHVSAAVLHYFQHELGRSAVSVGEFSLALERVLKHFGFKVSSGDSEPGTLQVAQSDLRRLACASGKAFELGFFSSLRSELELKLQQSPELVHFNGLRGCVKQLIGARRWSRRCQALNDQIVEYLRGCFTVQEMAPRCSLMVT